MLVLCCVHFWNSAERMHNGSAEIDQKLNFVVLIGSFQFWYFRLLQILNEVQFDEITSLRIFVTEVNLYSFFFNITIFANEVVISHFHHSNCMWSIFLANIDCTDWCETIVNILAFSQMVILDTTKKSLQLTQKSLIMMN